MGAPGPTSNMCGEYMRSGSPDFVLQVLNLLQRTSQGGARPEERLPGEKIHVMCLQRGVAGEAALGDCLLMLRLHRKQAWSKAPVLGTENTRSMEEKRASE